MASKSAPKNPPRDPRVWTGPKKSSRKHKISRVDPFNPNRQEKHYTGKKIKNMEVENERIPNSLRDMLTLMEQTEERSAKIEENRQRSLSLQLPAAQLFLGDDNTGDASESENDLPEPDNTIPQNTNDLQPKTNKLQNTKTRRDNNKKTTSSKKPQKDNTKDKNKTKPKVGKQKGKEGNSKKRNRDDDESDDASKPVPEDFYELQDHVKFGETVDRPPAISVKPKKIFKFDVTQDPKLLEKERIVHQARLAYEAAKKRKRSNTGNKFFL